MRVLSPGQPRSVEEPDRAGRKQEEAEQTAVFAIYLERWKRGPNHQEKPDQQANEQQDLPTPAEVHVLVALMSPEERVGVRELVLDAHPFAGKGSHDNQEQGAEENVHAEGLQLRLLAAD